MRIILYSTHCPKCKVLEKKLNQKQINYEEITDIKTMEEKGFLSVPILEVDGERMDFRAANNWINSLN